MIFKNYAEEIIEELKIKKKINKQIYILQLKIILIFF